MVFIWVYSESCKSDRKVDSETFLQLILNKYSISDTNISYELNSILKFDWDRLIILTSYFNREKLESCSGVNIPSSLLESTEAAPEYLFIKDKKIVSYISNDDKIIEKIQLLYDSNYNENNVTRFECGITNSRNLHIKQISNANPNWKGKTFLIFNK